MALSPGTRLGPYEVVEPLGAGGMGEVYRARDTRLGRDVALKVLPAEIATDPHRLRRFEQEARAVAALNHPHVLTLHDVGTHEGTPYVVTELLEGENLGEVLARWAPTQRQVLSWAVQAAQGLAAAHQKGIVHRDLKPENVFLTTDGRVKVLDFGLAKVARRDSAKGQAETESRPTGPGLLMGTLPYMSPEQVQGLAVDARSDIFSFGVVLYELLGRKHPFRRTTVGGTLTAILQEEPAPLTSLDAEVPRAVDGIVRRCLEKRKEERFQTAHDLGLALEAVLQAPPGAAVLEEVEERSPYPGLSSFTEKDASVFFGREAEVKSLWEKIRQRRLLAVIGPSGAGKTSFLRAGVIPSRPEGWGAVHFTPGTNPGLGLAHALTPVLAGDADAMRDLIDGVTERAQTGETDKVVSAAKRWRARHSGVLLVADQLEELFTLSLAGTRERFAALLARLADEADVHVVLSLRDDFLVPCVEQAPLAPAVTLLTVMLPLKREALRRAVVEPAGKRGYRFEDEALLEEMVGSVEGARAALPLLAFAVKRLWERRNQERKLLTREAYEEIGGVAGALAQHAEATMDAIGPERHGVVREIFRNLVTARGTRAVVDREEMLSAFPDRAATEEVLRRLIDARLVTSYEVEGKEGEPSHHRVEVVHESLLTAWPRLVRWQAQDEEGALLRDQLKQAAHLWEEKGRTSDLLWTGTTFREFELWRERYPGALTALEEDFARSMAEKARRKRRLVQAAVAATLVGVSSVAIVVSVLRQQAVQQARRAEREARLAVASKLVALGRSEIEHYPAATLAYARESLEVADNAEGRRLAVEALWRTPSLRVLPIEQGWAYDVMFSPDGTRLATTTTSETVLVYPDDGTAPTAVGGFVKGGATSFAFTPAGDALVGWNWNAPGPVRMISLADRRAARSFGPELPHGRGAGLLEGFLVAPRGVLIASRDGNAPDAVVHFRLEPYDDGPARWVGAVRRLANGEIDGTGTHLALVRDRSVRVRLVAGDERTPEREMMRLEKSKRVRLGFSLDGHRLAVGELDTGRLSLWLVDRPSSRPERVLARPNPETRFWPVLDATGARVAWGSTADHAVSLWDLAAPPDAAPRVVQRPDASETGMPWFDPGASWLAVAHQDSVAFWAIAQPWPRILAGQGEAVGRLRFTSDSRRLLSCARENLSVWPLDPAVAPARTRLSHEEGCGGLALTPDGRQVLWSAVRVHLTPVEGPPTADLVLEQGSRDDLMPCTAVDASGRWGATASLYTSRSLKKKIRIWDLVTGRTVREWAQAPEGEPDDGLRWLAGEVAFLADGRLIVGQAGGVRLLDPRTGASEWLWKVPPADAAVVVVSPDARRAAMVRQPQAVAGKFDLVGEIVVLDLGNGGRRSIGSHGSKFASLALDASGSVLVTGAPDGAVRVGPSDGREPHLLCCHAARVDAVAVSPDGKWIASGSGPEIRLWPMPDLSKPPLHTLPYDELMAKLRSLTNLEVVEDKAAATGYKIEIGPFPGWKDVPTW